MKMKCWLSCLVFLCGVSFAQTRPEFPVPATAFLKLGHAYLIYTEVGLPYLKTDTDAWTVMAPLETLANFDSVSLEYTKDCRKVTVTRITPGRVKQFMLNKGDGH